MATFNDDVDAGHCVVVEVSPDIHICGFCKQQYFNFEVFLAHKQNGCSFSNQSTAGSTTTATLTDSNPEFVLEEDIYQACVVKGVKKTLNKAPKIPSKKFKPVLSSKRHACCFSGCSFKTQYGQKDMERHLKTHTGEKPFECELCHKRFSRRDKLTMHSRSHTGEKPHKCKHCPYAAADSSSLKKHLRIHYDERPFKCQICPYASRNSSQLTVHLRSHTGDAPFQCQQCDAKFKINSDLKRHLRVHSGEKPYKCELCEYRCAMKGNLKSHVQIKHGPENSFQCQHCEFTSASKTALRQHSRHHQPVQSFPCSRCTYSSSSKGALKVHERVHSEERPFKCDLCGFASKRLRNLLVHKQKSHFEEPEKSGGLNPGRAAGQTAGGDSTKPVGSRYRAKLDAARAFCCDECDASFVREDSLRSHKKQHADSGHVLELQLSSPAHPVDVLPAAAQGSSVAPPCSRAPLKIFLSHPLGQQSSLVPAADGTSRTSVVLLSPEHQDLVVTSMIQQVNLLPPAPLGSSQTEPQTVLLAQLSSDNTTPLQAMLQTAVAAQDSSSSAQTLMGVCSELEGLGALIHEDTHVRVETKENSALETAAAPPDVSKTTLPGQDGALLVPSVSLGSQDVVVHSVPLIVSPQNVSPQSVSPQSVSPHTLYTDALT